MGEGVHSVCCCFSYVCRPCFFSQVYIVYSYALLISIILNVSCFKCLLLCYYFFFGIIRVLKRLKILKGEMPSFLRMWRQKFKSTSFFAQLHSFPILQICLKLAKQVPTTKLLYSLISISAMTVITGKQIKYLNISLFKFDCF